MSDTCIVTNRMIMSCLYGFGCEANLFKHNRSLTVNIVCKVPHIGRLVATSIHNVIFLKIKEKKRKKNVLKIGKVMRHAFSKKRNPCRTPVDRGNCAESAELGWCILHIP